MNCCAETKTQIEGLAVKDIPELRSKLVEVSTDYEKWKTKFKCSNCGQIWIETYSMRGQGSVPKVEREG